MGTPEIVAAVTPLNSQAAVPAWLDRLLAANEQVGRGQFVTIDPTTGYAVLPDGTVPGQVCVGVGDPAHLSDDSTQDGAAAVRVSQRWINGLMSSESGDSFADTDYGAPFYIASEKLAGKLSNFGGDNRSLGGLFFGLNELGNPILWAGPVAWAIARTLLLANAALGGAYQIADALASDTTAETAMERTPLHGTVTAIEFIGAAVAGDGTNFATMTVSKHDGMGGGATVIGTYSTDSGAEGAITAFVPAVFTLSTTATDLDLLETDVLTITVTKDGTGQILTGNIRVVQTVN